MHIHSRGSSLVSSSHLFEATWENALGHFRRALVECGSPIEIEHSQRIGLLFSKQVGDTNELKRWASIFDAEDVPTTALLLKALVSHDQWQAATRLLELNKSRAAAKELSEVLAQSLTAKGLWRDALQLVDFLKQKHMDESTALTKELTTSTSDTVDKHHDDDSYQIATNPAFLPAEERSKYCGFVSAVAQAFPREQDWEKAVKLLREVEEVVDEETKLKLYEYEVARLVHGGKKFNEVIRRSRDDPRFRMSSALLRSLLHCAVAVGDKSLSIQCLELLTSLCACAVSVTMFEKVCQLFVSGEGNSNVADLRRFESVVCSHANDVRSSELQTLISVFCADYDLRMPIFVTSNGSATRTNANPFLSSQVTNITQLDRVASTLLSQNRWKEALEIARQIDNAHPRDGHEKVIVDMIRASNGSWEKALLFFAT